MGVWLDIFRVLASVTTIIMLLSPIPAMHKVHSAKSTGVGSIVPLVSMVANCNTVMMFGYISEQYFPVFFTFLTGELLSLGYVVLFYRYTHEKPKAHKAFAIFGVPALLASVYGILGGLGYTNQTRHQVSNITGYFTILSSALLYTAPMERIGHVLRNRSAVFLNIHMICAGTLTNFMWIGYSLLSTQWIIFAPNIFCFVMGCIQIALYFVFHPSKHPLPVADPAMEDDNATVELVTASPRSDAIKKSAQSPCFVALASPLSPPRSQENASTHAVV